MTSTSRIAKPPNDLVERAERGIVLSRQDIVALLSLCDREALASLFQAADWVRARMVGEEIFLRGIIEFSNYCRNNCLYCGLRRDNHSVHRYRIPDDEIVMLAESVRIRGCGTVVLQSGEDPHYTGKHLSRLISRIKDVTGLAVTLSIGRRSYKDYQAFRAAGADRYLLRHETANPERFARLCPGRTLEERLRPLRWLRDLGYEVGTGCMVGLPGQGVEDLADDVLLIRDMDADMVGIGPFIPHEQTPLGSEPPGDPLMVLKMLAVVRLVTRNTNIPATTALGVLNSATRREAFLAGANIFMPVFTPQSYAGRYEIYPGKGDLPRADGALQDFTDFFHSIGRPVGDGPGNRRYTN